jgi:Cu-Zn family superoxide dismutase
MINVDRCIMPRSTQAKTSGYETVNVEGVSSEADSLYSGHSQDPIAATIVTGGDGNRKPSLRERCGASRGEVRVGIGFGFVLMAIIFLAIPSPFSQGGGDGSGAATGGTDWGSEPIYAACQLTATTQNELGAGLSGGTMYLTYEPLVGTHIEIEARDMAPGKHGVHIHTLGDLSDTQASASTGGHFNPHGAAHGCAPGSNRKAGDLGNLLVDQQGQGFYAEEANPLVQLGGPDSVVGRALVVHALEDSCAPVEGPRGDTSAGARIAHCTVGLDADSRTREDRRAATRRGYERAAAAAADAALAGLDTCSWSEATLPSTVHPLGYTLVLEPGLDGADGFSGQMSAQIAVSAPTTCVVMHARGLTVTSATLEHTAIATVLCMDAAGCGAVITDIGCETGLAIHRTPLVDHAHPESWSRVKCNRYRTSLDYLKGPSSGAAAPRTRTQEV